MASIPRPVTCLRFQKPICGPIRIRLQCTIPKCWSMTASGHGTKIPFLDNTPGPTALNQAGFAQAAIISSLQPPAMDAGCWQSFLARPICMCAARKPAACWMPPSWYATIPRQLWPRPLTSCPLILSALIPERPAAMPACSNRACRWPARAGFPNSDARSLLSAKMASFASMPCPAIASLAATVLRKQPARRAARPSRQAEAKKPKNPWQPNQAAKRPKRLCPQNMAIKKSRPRQPKAIRTRPKASAMQPGAARLLLADDLSISVCQAKLADRNGLRLK